MMELSQQEQPGDDLSLHETKILVGRLQPQQISSSSAAAAAAAAQMLINQVPDHVVALPVPEQQLKNPGGKHPNSKPPKVVNYRECMKNHAASIGGHSLDGCGEFMPSGDEGSIEALKCAACDCHRNFHKREVEGEPLICDICHLNRRDRNRKAAAIAAGVTGGDSRSNSGGANNKNNSNSTPASNPRLLALPGADQGLESGLQQQQLITLHGGSSSSMKKRFRTKFSMDQKERMFLFAEKLGWRIQKHDEASVQQFCAEVGVKRHVLKVWMHNNKHTFSKRTPSSATTPAGASPGDLAAPPPLHFNLSGSAQQIPGAPIS